MFSGDAAQKWVRKNENYKRKSWYLANSRLVSDMSSFTTVTSAAAYGIRVWDKKNPTCTYGLDSDYISSYIYLFVEKLCPMAVAGCNST